MLLARSLSPLALLLVLAGSALAQRPDSAPSPFRPLALPAPNVIRTGSGRPGTRYWQQRADYRIEATLDPARPSFAARETIHYANRCPTRCRTSGCSSSRTSARRQRHQPARPAAARLPRLDLRLLLQGIRRRPHAWSTCGSGRRRCTPTGDGTTMRVDLPRPLAPGAAARPRHRLALHGAGLRRRPHGPRRHALRDRASGTRAWRCTTTCAAGTTSRTSARASSTSSTAASTWRSPCRPTTSWRATGVLRNPERGPHGRPSARGWRARGLGRRRSRSSPPRRPATPATHPAGPRPGTLTWRFTADSVRDFAFAAAPDFRWDASGYRRDPGPHALPPVGARVGGGEPDGARRGPVLQRAVVSAIPTRTSRSIEGPIEGMEYPMITFDPRAPSREERQWVLAHELGHQWLPDDRRLERAALSLDGRGLQHLHRSRQRGARTSRARPTATASRCIRCTSTRTTPIPGTRAAADRPAGRGARPLLDRLPEAGADDADAALRGARARSGSTTRSASTSRPGRSSIPTPADFFRLMRDASGMDLDWFWRDWIYTTARLDQAVGLGRGTVGGAAESLCSPTAAR